MTCNLCKKMPAMFHTFVAQLGRSVPVCPHCLPHAGASIKVSTHGMGIPSIRMAAQPSIEDEFMNMFKTRSERVCCDTCGHDLIDLQRTTKLGCSDCYTAFEKQLAPMINSIHGGDV